LVQEKSGLGVSAMAKLKEHHIMCVEELARNQSVRKIASTFSVDESTLRYRLGSVLFPQGFKHDLGLEFRIVTLFNDGY
jgi:hypothetical protein